MKPLSRTAAAAALEAYVQEEIGAQRRLFALLEEQGRAARERETGELVRVSAALAEELAGGDERARRRVALVRELARELGAPPRASSLRSLAERLGPDGRRLARLCDELEPLAREVRRRGRLLVALLGRQRAVLREVLEAVVGCADGGGGERRGLLLNAEA